MDGDKEVYNKYSEIRLIDLLMLGSQGCRPDPCRETVLGII